MSVAAEPFNRKPIFDAVRSILGRGFTPPEIEAIDDGIDEALGIEPHEQEAPGLKVNDRFIAAAIVHLRREEDARPRAYRDHLGYWTIGVGRLIDPRRGGRITEDEEAVLLANDPYRKGKPWREWVLSDDEIDLLLRNDIARMTAAMDGWPAWQRVQGDVPRMVALLSMCFQMGPDGLAGFRNSLGLVAQGRFAEAADNMLKSRWAQQTPGRARRVTEMMRTGRPA